MDRVRSGEMDMEEAHRRYSYYAFVREMPTILDPEGYVLEAEYDSLPPWIATPYGDTTHDETWKHYICRVREGMMCAYEAAEAYFEAVMG